MRSVADLLLRPPVRGIPLRSYRRERLTELTMPVASALMEGGFVGVVADKIYHVHPSVLAVISAAPMFANLVSFAWTRMASGRRKVPVITVLQALIALLVAVPALLPEGVVGEWGLVASLVAARVLITGVVTVRSTIWRLNYPRESRGRLTGRLGLISSFTMTVTSLLGSFVLDGNPENFRLLYAIGALISSAGVLSFARVRLVGEDELIALERSAPPPGELERHPSMFAVLRADKLFASYLLWQFVAGVSNMMIEAPLLYLVSRQLGASYFESISVTTIVPFLVSTLTMPVWAAYLDRVHIAEFRSRQSLLWIVSQGLNYYGALTLSLPWLVASRVVLGLARGGGALAWQIGHNDFASPRLDAVYMGIHVTLTGVRGLIAPFGGMLLYVGWDPVALPYGLELPGYAGVDAEVFLIAALLTVGSWAGFWRLQQRIAKG
jgi:hypothetical protein